MLKTQIYNDIPDETMKETSLSEDFTDVFDNYKRQNDNFLKYLTTEKNELDNGSNIDDFGPDNETE